MQQQQQKKPQNPKSTQNLEVEDSDYIVGFNRLGASKDQLPVTKSKLEILYSIEKYGVTVIIAETGSGKTTQIPQFLVEAGYALNQKCIAITLPRRIAAVSVAKRVAEEMNVALGQEVGYHIRFDDQYTPNTMIKFLTDGMLVREMMSDPLLQKYSVVMIDDMHERSVNTDLIMGLLKKIQRRRKDLKLIVSSATLNAGPISRFFEDEEHGITSKVLQVEGRMFPVDIMYMQMPCKNYVTKAAEVTLDIHLKKPEGDILVFLTGQEEIESFIDLIGELSRGIQSQHKILCLPLYANMPIDAQMQVFNKAPYNTRKVVVSTNIAESTVTIDGIVYVIDSCFVKMKYYNYFKGSDILQVVPISKASGNQRAGRAGRVRPGECYRLCRKEDFEDLYPQTAPEICRSNLANIILEMKSLGVANLVKFDFLTRPPEETFVRGIELLYSLNAIDKSGNLTEDIGWKIAEIPIEPRYAVMLLISGKPEFNCSQEILQLVSMLSAQNIFFSGSPSSFVIRSKKKLGAKEGDHITLINIYIRYDHMKNKDAKKRFCQEHGLNEKALQSAQRIYKQLEKYMKKFKVPVVSCDDEPDAIMKCVLSGYFDRVAQRQPDGSYKSIRGKETLYLHPNCILHAIYPNWVVYNEVVMTGKNYMREVSTIDYKWLLEIAPHFYQDNKVQIIEARRNKEIEDLTKFEVQTKKKIKTEAQIGARPKKKAQTFTVSDMDFME